jgi:heat shock protein HslJ
VEPVTPGVPGAGDPSQLVDTRWNLVGYGQPDALTLPLDGSLATLDIDAEHMGGTTGCNHYSFDYTAEGQSLTFVEPGPTLTMMACEETIMQQETDFIKVLSAVTGYTLEENRLTLTGAEGVLVFETAKPLALEGVEWHLSGLAQNEAVVSMAGDEQITLTLQNGQANGFAGCNTFFGGYEVLEDTLKFSALGSTKMACEGEAGQREIEFLTALEHVARYEITRSQLALLDGEGHLVMTLGAPTSK